MTYMTDEPYDNIHFTMSLGSTPDNRERVGGILEEVSDVDSYDIDEEASDIDVRVRVKDGSHPYRLYDALVREFCERLPQGIQIKGARV